MTHNYVWNFTGGNFPLNSQHYPETLKPHEIERDEGQWGGGERQKREM